MQPTILMVHGAFCGGWAFELFRGPFEAAGWRVLAPDLPGHDGQRPVSGLSMSDYAAAVAELCADLPEPPVLLGHSLGGLVCQMAARKVRPAAMVLLAPSPPWGVSASSLEEGLAALGVQLADPFWSGELAPDPGLMERHSLDRVEPVARLAALARMAPESGRALHEALTWWLDPFMTTRVEATPAIPALAIVGGCDVVHPPATIRLMAGRMGMPCHTIEGMSHWLIGETGWEAVAETALSWLEARLRAAA